MHRHQCGQPLTIGVPTANNDVYILNDQDQQVEVGEQGVMWAGGAGVSRGYVGQPEKTAEKYRADPFAADGSMMYNTGDIGRWRPDGAIDMLGRVDDQIKIKVSPHTHSDSCVHAPGALVPHPLPTPESD